LSRISSGISNQYNATEKAVKSVGTASYNAVANAPANIKKGVASTGQAALGAAKAAPLALATTVAAVPYAVGKGLYNAPGAIARTASATSTKIGNASNAVRKTLKESVSQENFNKQAAINQKAFNFINANMPKGKTLTSRELNMALSRAKQQLMQVQDSYNNLREAAEDKKEFDLSEQAIEAHRLVVDAEHNVKEVETALQTALNGPQLGGNVDVDLDVGLDVGVGKKRKKKRTFYALDPTRRYKKRRRARTLKGRRKFF